MRLNKEWLFPVLLILWNLGAAAVYFRQRDWRRGTYFVSSALCLAMVTANK
jgi:hypothetical protein